MNKKEKSKKRVVAKKVIANTKNAPKNRAGRTRTTKKEDEDLSWVKKSPPKGVPLNVYQGLVCKDSADLVSIFARGEGWAKRMFPEAYKAFIEGIRLHLAPEVEKHLHLRYVDGKCTLCKGSAKSCSKRHRAGMSCS